MQGNDGRKKTFHKRADEIKEACFFSAVARRVIKIDNKMNLLFKPFSNS